MTPAAITRLFQMTPPAYWPVLVIELAWLAGALVRAWWAGYTHYRLVLYPDGRLGLDLCVLDTEAPPPAPGFDPERWGRKLAAALARAAAASGIHACNDGPRRPARRPRRCLAAHPWTRRRVPSPDTS